MATNYTTYIYNYIRNAEEISPSDLFTGTKSPHYKLKYIHVWIFTVYVLDPTLQQSQKLPKC